jgi:predicted nucleic acid-binding protein
MELVDTSVWAQRHNSQIRDWFVAALVEGDLAVCDMVALEILAGATTARLYTETMEDLRGVPWLHMGRREWERALEVYSLLEAKGTQVRRSVKHADLLIAACAERYGVTLVHYDRDYEIIAEATSQQTRWVAPRGTLH